MSPAIRAPFFPLEEESPPQIFLKLIQGFPASSQKRAAMDLNLVSCTGAAVGTLSAFSLHEWAHARAAYGLGDPTAKYAGRLSLNPVRHLDPVGSCCLLISLLASQGSMALGWARPVLVDRSLFRNPYGDAALVALAGPVANLLLAASLAPLLRTSGLGFASWGLVWVVRANLSFALFNLFPLPPLDGWKVLQGLLPQAWAAKLDQLERSLGPAAPALLLLASFLVISPVTRPLYFYLSAFLLGAP